MATVEQHIEGLFTKKRWLIHVGFWLAVIMVYAVFFGRRNSNYFQTLFFIGLLMPITIATTYFFNYFLIPRYLLTGRTTIFLLYSLYTLLVSVFAEVMVALMTFLVMAELRIHNMSPASVDIIFLLASLLMIVFLGVAIKMVLRWRQSQVDYQRLIRDKVETELKLLKAQLNPHFLFNTLNNLYYLTSQKSDRAPQAVLQLSEILDYVLHAGKTMFVPLAQELRQVENYTALEMLRYEGRVQVTHQVTGPVEQHQIAPMILITLIENAFKHGVMPTAASGWIAFEVNATPDQVEISLRNSYKQTATQSGMGLANLRDQLALLYPDRHQLTVQALPTEFSVRLTLQT